MLSRKIDNVLYYTVEEFFGSILENLVKTVDRNLDLDNVFKSLESCFQTLENPHLFP
jgi:hypothetical protein